MKLASVPFLSLAIGTLAAIVAVCSPNPALEKSPMHEDIEGLARLVTLPPSVQSARWQVLQIGDATGLGPTDWALAAVVELPSEIRRELIAKAAPIAMDRDFPRSFVLSWFPPELRALWMPSEAELLRLGAQPMDATALFKPPLQSGFFLPFGDAGFVFVYLYTR
jgi:hypothetical protein